MERYIEQGCFEACSFDFNVQTCFVVQSLQYLLYSGKFPKFPHVPDVLRRSHDLMVSVF